jgi:hypothetical protein
VAKDPYGAVKAVQQATVNLFADMGIQPANLQADLVKATASTDKLAPVTKITAPAAGTALPGGSLSVSGTATDAGGGTVAMVEVSFDGGKTWKRANGTDKWTYEWQVPAGTTTATILTRAIDDSVNVEKPGKGVALGAKAGGR